MFTWLVPHWGPKRYCNNIHLTWAVYAGPNLSEYKTWKLTTNNEELKKTGFANVSQSHHLWNKMFFVWKKLKLCEKTSYSIHFQNVFSKLKNVFLKNPMNVFIYSSFFFYLKTRVIMILCLLLPLKIIKNAKPWILSNKNCLCEPKIRTSQTNNKWLP